MKILIMGLPGSGKTTLAKQLAQELSAVHFNADDVRTNLNKDLGFSREDRIEQARRMGFLAQTVSDGDKVVICDFVCPLPECRDAFGPDFIISMDTIATGRFEDTNKLFVPLEDHFRSEKIIRLTNWTYNVVTIANEIRRHLWERTGKNSHALLIGRYQPFHDGHLALVKHGIESVGAVCIAVRDTGGIDESNPYTYQQVKQKIIKRLRLAEILPSQVCVIQLPNITEVQYGRDVGYRIVHVDLSDDLKNISATKIRQALRAEKAASES